MMLAIKIPGATFLIIVAVLLGGCIPPGPRALLAGKRLLEKGRADEAVEELRQATALLKTNAIAWDYLGLACHYTGQTAEAERAYQRALQYDRDLTEAHYNLGCLWLEQNKLEGAKRELMACTLRRDNWVEGQLKLGTVQLRLHDLSGAERSFGEALRFSPQNAEALNGLGLARAQHAGEMSLSLEALSTLNGLGLAWVQHGHPADAGAFFTSALKAQPQYAPALLNLAIVSQQFSRDRRLALQKYQDYLALKPAPPNAEAVSALTRQLEQELNPPGHPAANRPAETDLAAPAPPLASTEAGANAGRAANPPRPASATNAPRPAPPPAWMRGGATGAPPPAVARERGTLPAGPVSKPARGLPAPSTAAARPKAGTVPGRQAGSRYAYLSPAKPARGNRAEAQRAFDQGSEAQSAHRLSEASQAYRRATQLDPAFFEAYYNLGVLATEARNWPAALAAYEQALAINPDSPNARYNFALVLSQANYLADAANELEKLLAGHANETRAHLALANLYAQKLHQPAKARLHYEKVLDLAPGLPQATEIRNWLEAHGE
jgi:tetratricopeptide (TPR) repeat protein